MRLNAVFPKIVGFVTDFGLKDSYVSEIHSILTASCPSVRIIDISHQVELGDVEAAAYLLSRVRPVFPSGAVFLAVVDPGVGGDRQAVIIENDGRFLVGPDNGIFSRIIQWKKPLKIRACGWDDVPSERRSLVFQGRDLFAPLVAMLLNGAGFETTGVEARLRATFPPPTPAKVGNSMVGRVIYIDHFGNLATDLPIECVDPASTSVSIGRQTDIRFTRNYEGAPSDSPFWTCGSDGSVEIAWRRRNAAECLGVKIGEKVTASMLTEGL